MLFDTRHGGAHQSAHRIDRSQARRAFRAAAQTGPKPRTLRGGRAGIKPHVVALCRPRRTDGAAIDVRRADGDEKTPVEAPVAGANRTKTSVGVELHGDRIAKIRGDYSPFSDLETTAVPAPPGPCPVMPLDRSGPLGRSCLLARLGRQ